MDEHQNAGEATVDEQREGDYTHGETAGPYGGTDESAGGGETPAGTSAAEPVEHVGDGEQTEEGAAGDGEGAAEGDEAEGQGDGQGDGVGEEGSDGEGAVEGAVEGADQEVVEEGTTSTSTSTTETHIETSGTAGA